MNEQNLNVNFLIKGHYQSCISSIWSSTRKTDTKSTHDFVISCWDSFYVNKKKNNKEILLYVDTRILLTGIKSALPLKFIKTIYMSQSTVRTANMKYVVLSTLAVLVLFISFDTGIHGFQQLSENVPEQQLPKKG